MSFVGLAICSPINDFELVLSGLLVPFGPKSIGCQMFPTMKPSYLEYAAKIRNWVFEIGISVCSFHQTKNCACDEVHVINCDIVSCLTRLLLSF